MITRCLLNFSKEGGWGKGVVDFSACVIILFILKPFMYVGLEIFNNNKNNDWLLFFFSLSLFNLILYPFIIQLVVRGRS